MTNNISYVNFIKGKKFIYTFLQSLKLGEIWTIKNKQMGHFNLYKQDQLGKSMYFIIN